MQTSCISFLIKSSNYDMPLGVRILLDDQVLTEHHHLREPINFEQEINDDIGDHVLQIELFNKTAEHTRIDQQGNILEDVLLEIVDISVDGINLENIMPEISKYCHNNNGNSDFVEEKFYGAMGCNGSVKIPFSTPIYLWLLENL